MTLARFIGGAHDGYGMEMPAPRAEWRFPIRQPWTIDPALSEMEYQFDHLRKTCETYTFQRGWTAPSDADDTETAFAEGIALTYVEVRVTGEIMRDAGCERARPRPQELTVTHGTTSEDA